MMAIARIIDGATVVLLAALLVLVARVLWHVGTPRRYPCPQCKGTRTVSPTKALTKIRCTYCGGVGEVWR